MTRTLAIFSPNQNAYSETFIKAHRSLPFNIKYYYGGWLPVNLEDSSSFLPTSVLTRIKGKFNKRFNLPEYALLNSLKEQKVDCILAEYALSACATLNVVQHLQIPLIVHFHGFDASTKAVIQEYSGQYKKMFAYADTIIAVSNKMRKDLITLGCPGDKVIVSTYGPNPDFQNITPSYKTQQFVAVGRFTEKKAPHLTVTAFKKVIQAFPAATLVMIGDGELLSACKNLARGLGLTNNIKFKGILEPHEIKAVFQDSLAFVQHSITAESGDAEGTPVSVLEAQAAGLAVISTYHGGIPDVVLTNETGLLVDEFDVKGMAENMIRVLQDNDLAKKLGTAGRKRIVEHFTLEKHLKDLESMVSASVKRKKKTSLQGSNS